MDQEVDWLVAGAGAAGMTGAVVAHQLGGSVLVVEKEAVYGGTTAKSGGVAWIPGNHCQKAAGIADSIEEGYQYLKGLIGDSVDDRRIRAYAETAPEMLQFMMQHSHIEYSPLPQYMDYYENIPGHKNGGRSMDAAAFSLRKLGKEAASLRLGHYDGLLLPFNITVVEGRKLQAMNVASYWLGFKLLLRYKLDFRARWRKQHDDRVTLGPAVVARLRRSLMDRDIPLWLNAPMQELIIEKGAVTGAVVQRDGGSQRIRARRGVLIATGGFSHNVALREKHQQAPTGCAWTAAAPGATGDGITMGEAAGAALEFMHCAWWSSSGRCGNLATPRVNPWERRVLTAQVKPAEKRLRLQRQSRLE